MTIQTYTTVHKPQPITNPRRLLPLQRMQWSKDAYGTLLAFQHAAPEEDETRYYNESSFDFPF